MLVLERRRNEEIIITDKASGDIIKIIVLSVRGNKVKIGLEDQSQKYIFMRKEVQDRIDKEKQQVKLPDPLNEPEPDRSIHFSNETLTN